MVFGDLFNAMIDPKQESAKKVPKHLPDFAVAAANPDLAVKMVLRKEHRAKAAWWKAHVRAPSLPPPACAHAHVHARLRSVMRPCGPVMAHVWCTRLLLPGALKE